MKQSFINFLPDELEIKSKYRGLSNLSTQLLTQHETWKTFAQGSHKHFVQNEEKTCSPEP